MICMHQNISILKKKNFFSQNYRIPHLGNYLNLQQVFFVVVVKDLHFLFKIKLAVLRVQTLSLLIYKNQWRVPAHPRSSSVSRVKSLGTPMVRCSCDIWSVFYEAGAYQHLFYLLLLLEFTVLLFTAKLLIFFKIFFSLKKETNSVYTLTVWVQEK